MLVFRGVLAYVEVPLRTITFEGLKMMVARGFLAMLVRGTYSKHTNPEDFKDFFPDGWNISSIFTSFWRLWWSASWGLYTHSANG